MELNKTPWISNWEIMSEISAKLDNETTSRQCTELLSVVQMIEVGDHFMVSRLFSFLSIVWWFFPEIWVSVGVTQLVPARQTVGVMGLTSLMDSHCFIQDLPAANHSAAFPHLTRDWPIGEEDCYFCLTQQFTRAWCQLYCHTCGNLVNYHTKYFFNNIWNC